MPVQLVPNLIDLPEVTETTRISAQGTATAEYRAELRKINDWANAWTVAFSFALAVLVVAIAANSHNLFVYMAAFVVMGGVQSRLFILTHEAAHHLLFTNKRLNDFVWLRVISYATFGSGSKGYRRGHMAHHRDEMGPDEPDVILYSFYPQSLRKFSRKMRRDLAGVSAWPLQGGVFRSLGSWPEAKYGLKTLTGMATTFAPFALMGITELWLLLWFAPYVTLFPFTSRLRSIAEHGGMQRSQDKRLTTHHVRQGILPRLLITPINSGYHLAYHLALEGPT